MSAVIDAERAYRPLNGEEAIEAILMEFRKALTNSGMFPLHRVWHEFEFQGGVRVKGWATKTEEVKFAGGGEVSEQAPIGDLISVDGKVAAGLSGEPPSVTRERLAEAQAVAAEPAQSSAQTFHDVTTGPDGFACAKCGKPALSKAGKVAHERFCKVEAKDEISVRSDSANLPATDEG